MPKILTPTGHIKAEGVAKCSACQTIKPEIEFYRDFSRHNNCSSRCRDCERVRQRELYKQVFLKRELEALVDLNPAYRDVLVRIAEKVAA